MTKRFVIVAEDEIGARLTRDLCDRVVVERGADWLRVLWADPRTPMASMPHGADHAGVQRR